MKHRSFTILARSGSLAALAASLTLSCGSSAPPRVASVSTPAQQPTRPSPLQAMPVTPADAAAAETHMNPFQGAEFYINPDYQQKLDEAIASHPQEAELLRKVKGNPTGLWVDTIEAVEGIPRHLQGAEAASQEKGHPVLPVFVVYDLPNRDCSAKASAGELTYDNGGEKRYREEFIDVIAAHFRAHSSQRIIVILEPDSLPNVVTNLDVAQCALSEQLYKNSIAYAIAQLSLPNVYIYVDAAHSGWLGWDGNRSGIANVFKEVLDMAGGTNRIRGFATNVSNYTPLSGADGKALEPSNPCPDELSYVSKLAESLAAVGITDKGFIIDTSRNGRGGIRQRWGSWCNVSGAGLGERPTVSPTALVDAYFWVKPPGESDGIADSTASRFDENCASDDATPGAPEAGDWFESYFIDLARNASPSL